MLRHRIIIILLLFSCSSIGVLNTSYNTVQIRTTVKTELMNWDSHELEAHNELRRLYYSISIIIKSQ